MFKIIKKTDRYVYFSSRNKLAVVSIATLKRGRKHVAKRKNNIRKPVHVVIDGERYKFTQNEWQKALELGEKHKADTKYVQHSLVREEIADKVKLCPKLADQRARRLGMS